MERDEIAMIGLKFVCETLINIRIWFVWNMKHSQVQTLMIILETSRVHNKGWSSEVYWLEDYVI